VQGAHARSGEGVRRRARQIGTELVAIAVQVKQHRLHLTQVPQQVWPGNFDLPLIQTLLQVYLQAESQETGDDMADRRIIPMMIDRPDFQGGFLLSKGSFHPPQAFLGLGHLGGRQVGIGSEDELAVQSGIQMSSFPASANLTFPHLLTLGVSVSRLSPWVFNFDVTWTGWSSFRAIEVRSSQPLLFNGVPTKLLVTPRDWHDAWTFRFGVNCQVHPLVKLRAGYTYDLSSIPDSTFDPQIVNTDQHIFTVGADVKIRRLTLGLAYNYLLSEKRQKNNTIATNGVPAPLQANGSYQSTAHGWGISLAYQF